MRTGISSFLPAFPISLLSPLPSLLLPLQQYTMTSLRALVILLAAALFASHALASPRGARPGGWTPIKDLNDPHVREIAGFAISEHNKQANAALTLSRVVKGEQQTVAGTNYRFVLIAQDGSGGSASYEAVVWEKPWENFRQLTSFKLVQS